MAIEDAPGHTMLSAEQPNVITPLSSDWYNIDHGHWHWEFRNNSYHIIESGVPSPNRDYSWNCHCNAPLTHHILHTESGWRPSSTTFAPPTTIRGIWARL